MLFDPRHRGALAVSPNPPGRGVAAVDRGAAMLALAVAAALIAGLAWNLFATQSQGRQSLRDAMQRRAALTAELIGSAFMAAGTPEQARAEFGGPPRALRQAVRTHAAAAEGQRVTVLDAGGRVLAAAGAGSDPTPSARGDVRLALRGAPAISDAFADGRRGWVAELAVPFPSASGRRVLVVSAPVEVVQSFTHGFFSTASAFRGTQGHLIDGSGRTLSSTQHGSGSVPGPVWAELEREQTSRYGDRVFVAATVPSSHWKVVLSVPAAVLYDSVNGAPGHAAWVLFAAFTAAICALLALGFRAARSARRLAVATESRTPRHSSLINVCMIP
jgi:hypothetical protein